jgi:hypothetical protein
MRLLTIGRIQVALICYHISATKRRTEIYNLACPASPIHYQRDPVQTTKTSVHGAINMLGLAKRLRAKILQASNDRHAARYLLLYLTASSRK